MKKLVTALLTVSMVAGLMAGCGSKVPVEESTSASNEPIKESTADSGSEVQEEEQELVSLRLVLYGDITPRREEFFKNEFHDAILEDLNIDLTMEILPWGSANVVQTMLAAGEAFAFNHRMDQGDHAQKGYLATIPMDMIEENCTEYLAMRGKNGFECGKFSGDIYVVPFGSKAYGGQSQFYTARKDILDELGYKAEEITTTEKLLEVFEAVHQAYPDMRVSMYEDMSYKTVGYALTGISATTMGNYCYVNECEDSDKVYSFYESDLFKAQCEWNANLLEKGYIIGDTLTDPAKSAADWKAGNVFARAGAPAEIVETGFINTVPGAEITRIRIDNTPYTITMDFDWGISISASDAENVERWLQLFNWMYQDKETYEFCIYGVEGKDFERNADGTIKKLVGDVFWEDWFMMASCYQSYPESISEENIKMYEASDDSAVLSKTAGFVFDSSLVSTEMSMVKAVEDEYMIPVARGYVDYEENYSAVIQKMKDAGLDTIVAEYQKQFSEWYANK